MQVYSFIRDSHTFTVSPQHNKNKWNVNAKLCLLNACEMFMQCTNREKQKEKCRMSLHVVISCIYRNSIFFRKQENAAYSTTPWLANKLDLLTNIKIYTIACHLLQWILTKCIRSHTIYDTKCSQKLGHST